MLQASDKAREGMDRREDEVEDDGASESAVVVAWGRIGIETKRGEESIEEKTLRPRTGWIERRDTAATEAWGQGKGEGEVSYAG